MGDKVLRALDNPAQVTHAQLPSIPQSDGQGQARGIAERLGVGGKVIRDSPVEASLAQLLRAGQVQAEKVAAIVRHPFILTSVEM